jgi:hypothetical protein
MQPLITTPEQLKYRQRTRRDEPLRRRKCFWQCLAASPAEVHLGERLRAHAGVARRRRFLALPARAPRRRLGRSMRFRRGEEAARDAHFED